MTEISSYHAHVYFDANTADTAQSICEAAAAQFGAAMGRMHQNPLGPHPMGSCQLDASPEQFAQMLPWLALNRAGLIVFCHPNTGDALADHRDHAIWLGTGLELNLSIFD